MFVTNGEGIAEGLQIINPILKPETIFWIAYPKKSSGMNSGLQMMGDWEEPAKYGLRVVTSVSINDTWTALRFRFEGLSKLSDSRNDNISKMNLANILMLKTNRLGCRPVCSKF